MYKQYVWTRQHSTGNRSRDLNWATQLSVEVGGFGFIPTLALSSTAAAAALALAATAVVIAIVLFLIARQTAKRVESAAEQRRQAEESRERSEEKFKNLVERANDWFWEVDENTVYTYASPRSRDLIGYEPEEVVGRNPFDFMPPDEAERVMAEFRPIEAQHIPFTLLENTLVHKDGHLVVVETSGMPIFDRSGGFRGYRGIDRDITDRKKVEEALRKRLSFEYVVTSISTEFINLPADQIDAGIDRALETIGEFTGVDRAYVFQFYDDLKKMDNTHEWSRAGVTAEIEQLRGLNTADFGWLMERLQRPETVHIPRVADLSEEASFEKAEFDRESIKSLIVVPMTYRKKLVGFVGFDSVRTEKSWTEDDTVLLKIVGEILVNALERKRAEEELRESEERFRFLFEHNPDAAMLLVGSRFAAANPAVTRVLGYEPHDILGRTPWEISPDFQPDGMSSHEKALRLIRSAVEQGPQKFEWVCRHKGGALLDCEVSLLAYTVRDTLFVHATVRDVTERKRMEEMRRKLERDLESQKRQFYRETIRSVTGGKLDICEEDEVAQYLTKAEMATEVNSPAETASARHMTRKFCRKKGLQGENLSSFMMGVGEAITNAVKHGIHGSVYAGGSDSEVWVGVADKGKGIESLLLPRATLMRGFSTKPSLGLGYSIMMDVADRILLKTDKRGTTVVLIKSVDHPVRELSLDQLPDTWEGIPR